MSIFKSTDLRLLGFYVVLISVCCSPIWSVEYFVTQDGSPHLYNGYLMGELLKGNAFVGQYFALSAIPLPNSSGHWLIVLLLQIFSPFIVTKLVVMLAFAGFVAATGWLRYETAGRDGLKTSLLIGTALAFNWMWLMGFYNFIFGVVGFIFTMGLYYAWREQIGFGRGLMLCACVLVVYLSHFLGFVALSGSLLFLAILASREQIKKNLLVLASIFIPVIPLIVLFKMASESGGGFSPHWQSLSDPYSLSNWINQIMASDAFIIISRKTLPFSSINSPYLALLAPSLWIAISFILLSIGTLLTGSRSLPLQREKMAFVLLLIISLAAAVLVPDDFGLANGGILGPRVLLCALVFFVPLFDLRSSVRLKRAAQVCLGFVIVFQTLAVWDYARVNDVRVREFLAAGQAIGEYESVAGVVIVADGRRFHGEPVAHALTLLGMNRNILIWDNYELGYYLFPITAKSASDRQFVYELTTANGFILNDPHDMAVFPTRLEALDSVLQANHTKINKLLVWNADARVESVLQKWFDAPIFDQGNVRVFSHK